MRIKLPEQVALDIRTAGFGSRALAYIIDFLIRWGSIFLVCITALYIFAVFATPESMAVEVMKNLFDNYKDVVGEQVKVLISIAIFIIVLMELAYPVYFEQRHDGRTPGKRFIGLRVVDEHGLPISFSSSLIRNILLFVDFLPSAGLVALVSMLLSDKAQRLGDLAGKTLVVYDIQERKQIPVGGNIKTGPRGLIVLPGELYTSLEQYLGRREEFFPEARQAIKDNLVKNLTKMGANPDPLHVEKWLEEVYQDALPKKQIDELAN